MSKILQNLMEALGAGSR